LLLVLVAVRLLPRDVLMAKGSGWLDESIVRLVFICLCSCTMAVLMILDALVLLPAIFCRRANSFVLSEQCQAFFEAARQGRALLASEVGELHLSHINGVRVLRRQVALDYDREVWRLDRSTRQALEQMRSLQGGLWSCFPSFHGTAGGESLACIVEEFRTMCPEQVDRCRTRFEEQRREGEEELKLRCAEFEVTLARRKEADIKAQRAAILARSVAVQLLPLPPNKSWNCNEHSLELTLSVCLAWLGCPLACALAPVSVAFAEESASFRSHGRNCPRACSCSICGFLVAVGDGQRARCASHRKCCAPWEVDGLLWRHFFASPPSLPAHLAAAAVQKALHTLDSGGFPGTIILNEAELVCCPHFGCSRVCEGREEAILHAASCMDHVQPQWSIAELQDRLQSRGNGSCK